MAAPAPAPAKTHPLHLNGLQLVCQSVFVRFCRTEKAAQFHRIAEAPGAHFLVVQTDEKINVHRILYVTASGIVLKSISYNRDEVIEVMQEESLCLAAFVDPAQIR